jgi:chromate reductase, NAD(P)H dehydrogenase (quinone)
MTISGISGSLREGSYNALALRQALRFAAEKGNIVNEISLKTLNLPAYDEDIASQPPSGVSEFREAVRQSDVIVIASPEYNYSVPGGLKNAIDWASRQRNAFAGKVAAIMGASSGPFGTIRMQPHLRMIMTALDVLVVPQPQVFIRNARESFTPSGDFVDKKLEERVRVLIRKSLILAKALNTQ